MDEFLLYSLQFKRHLDGAEVVSQKDVFKGMLYLLKYVCLCSCAGIALLITIEMQKKPTKQCGSAVDAAEAHLVPAFIYKPVLQFSTEGAKVKVT